MLCNDWSIPSISCSFHYLSLIIMALENAFWFVNALTLKSEDWDERQVYGIWFSIDVIEWKTNLYIKWEKSANTWLVSNILLLFIFVKLLALSLTFMEYRKDRKITRILTTILVVTFSETNLWRVVGPGLLTWQTRINTHN